MGRVAPGGHHHEIPDFKLERAARVLRFGCALAESLDAFIVQLLVQVVHSLGETRAIFRDSLSLDDLTLGVLE